MALVGVADMGVQPVRARRLRIQRRLHHLRDGHRQRRVVGTGQPRPVGGQHDAGQRGHADTAAAMAPSMAPASLSTSSAISASEMMKGGASSTWSPSRPSMVPPIG